MLVAASHLDHARAIQEGTPGPADTVVVEVPPTAGTYDPAAVRPTAPDHPSRSGPPRRTIPSRRSRPRRTTPSRHSPPRRTRPHRSGPPPRGRPLRTAFAPESRAPGFDRGGGDRRRGFGSLLTEPGELSP
ncbi:hypothetical protein ACFQX6_59165 [Streptosporangium lutulentum]